MTGLSAGTPQVADGRIAAAQRGFLAWAVGERAAITVNAAKAAAGDADATQALNEVAHRLRGTSGTLSFWTLVEPAAELEAATGSQANASGISSAASRLLDSLAALAGEDAR